MTLHKLSATTTYGAPAKICKVNGFIVLYKKDKSFPDFVSYNFIIYQEVLSSYKLPFGTLYESFYYDSDPYMINPLTTPSLNNVLVNSEERDLMLHIEILWLTRK
ncbi:hypothetical protein RF11_00705 [Thelohanellus kitauei]|uniref:Uncharacterized protein n=1 Tax=Thelohanellus kitauei TaxID=669202 RepID=A0A0C2NKX8_THEKT|nr:hypothetical protein RF11_00705 [Thelohanellus kitauei]